MTDENNNPMPETPVAPEAVPVPPAPPVAPPAPPAAPTPGYAPPPPAPGYVPPQVPSYAPQAALAGDKNKIVAGILAILLGALGIHKFYLGYTKEGIILLAVSLISFGMLAWATSIVGLIEGIMYLTKTDEDFYAMYVAGRKSWF